MSLICPKKCDELIESDNGLIKKNVPLFGKCLFWGMDYGFTEDFGSINQPVRPFQANEWTPQAECEVTTGITNIYRNENDINWVSVSEIGAATRVYMPINAISGV